MYTLEIDVEYKFDETDEQFINAADSEQIQAAVIEMAEEIAFDLNHGKVEDFKRLNVKLLKDGNVIAEN